MCYRPFIDRETEMSLPPCKPSTLFAPFPVDLALYKLTDLYCLEMQPLPNVFLVHRDDLPLLQLLIDLFLLSLIFRLFAFFSIDMMERGAAQLPFAHEQTLRLPTPKSPPLS